MGDSGTRTEAELLDEIGRLRAHISDLERTATTHRRAEQQLERKSDAWLEYSPVCTKIVDLDFNLQYMSRAGIDGLGIEDISDFYGKPYPFDFYPQAFRDEMTRNLTRAKETGEVTTQEAAVVDTDGGELWFHSTVVPVKGDDGEVDYLMVVSIDTTERKRAEDTRVDLERQVQQAQKLESLGVLAGGIAHDFNNILMGVLGNADLALDELSPHNPARSSVEDISSAAKRAAELAKQMLAYSGKGRFVIEPIQLNDLVEEMAHLLEISISKQVVLKYNFSTNLPVFDGDATQIRQVIMNLITNASEAIGDVSGVVSLSTGAMDCDRAYLDETKEILRAGLDEVPLEGIYTYFEVADTGCGMDEETVGKVFDPFFTTKYTGRGLGMAAVMGIIRGHKGAIKVYSEVGKGTTFKILFPATSISDSAAVAGGESGAEAKWRGSGTVLLADDEETVCTVGKKMLERLGFTVITAHDGRETLELFREHADDIVCTLLDLTMPHVDGEEAFREVRRIRTDAPVILCSGYNQQDVTQRFAGKGLAGFIQKPYNLTTLRRALKQAIGDAEN